ncbi:MAG TPA: multicopper oxidase family protein [Anaeromyxobacteraceae bacterium]|nr:multicopper oxidase family protein [Anaeromyxobacteraceae bacterium]
MTVGGSALLGEALEPRPARAQVAMTPIRFTPFTVEMPRPPLMPAVPPFAQQCVFGVPTTAPAVFHEVHMRRAVAQIIPGVDTPIQGYDGLYPGPTLRSHTGIPDVVRMVNELPVETVVHQHGGHNPAASDGSPFPDEVIFPGESRDYCYPNASAGGDPNENPSTMWYHDHAPGITGPNVYSGLAAFTISTDALEDGLISSGVLPAPAFDVPMALQDKAFNADGTLFFNPFNHDGFLGDVFVANGKAQPFFNVERRKYRFRILDGSNARFYLLNLSSGQPFLQIAADSWLLPVAVQRSSILLANAQRADLVIDFTNSPDLVYLQNILRQDNGRGPGGDLRNPDLMPPVPLVQFRVGPRSAAPDATVAPGTRLRPNTPIGPGEIVRTRQFEFERSDGAWQINGRFFDPARSDANPALGTAERWILKNGGGGWWHPIHIHLEAHQIQTFDASRVLPQQPLSPPNFFKRDTTLLGPGDTAEIFMRFRDHPGRFVFHCHNTEHEDDAMMTRFDVVG